MEVIKVRDIYGEAGYIKVDRYDDICTSLCDTTSYLYG